MRLVLVLKTEVADRMVTGVVATTVLEAVGLEVEDSEDTKSPGLAYRLWLPQ
jgi:hypothetical protein